MANPSGVERLQIRLDRATAAVIEISKQIADAIANDATEQSLEGLRASRRQLNEEIVDTQEAIQIHKERQKVKDAQARDEYIQQSKIKVNSSVAQIKVAAGKVDKLLADLNAALIDIDNKAIALQALYSAAGNAGVPVVARSRQAVGQALAFHCLDSVARRVEAKTIPGPHRRSYAEAVEQSFVKLDTKTK